MASPEELETNEAGWWSNWADVRWTGPTSYVMLSSDFDEYFFNRGGFLKCEVEQNALARMESEFELAGRPPCFSVLAECKGILGTLTSAGYSKVDEMSVMRLGQPKFRKADGLTVKKGRDVNPVEWASVYCLSFYGELALHDAVTKIVERLAGEPSATLFAGEKDGRVVGVLAAFRTPSLLGAYCIGTLGTSRGMGVAGSLISEASKVASTEARELVLQTIVSDGVEDYYSKGGFRRLYLKQVMKRGTPRSGRLESRATA